MADSRRMLGSLAILTFVTGLVDAVSVLSLGHVFTANMTGNLVFLGFALAGTGRTSVVSSLYALAGFLAGAVAGGRINRPASRFRVSLALETTLLAAAGAVAGIPFERDPRGLVVVLLAAAMGLQNAAVRRLGVADMTTTVLTLTLTGLGADSRLAGGDAPRTGRRVASVLLMVAGALSGAVVLRRGPPEVILLAAALAACAWMMAE